MTVETRFLRIHFPAAGEPGEAVRTALAAASVGDDLVLRLSAEAGWIPHGPVHLVVSDEADGMTAYTVPSWGWGVLSADPGAVTLRLRGRQDWVPDALAHELGHLVGHRVAGALPPNASYGLSVAGVAEGRGLGLGVVVPMWQNVPYGWSEGAAEWWSDRIGVNRWSAGRAALIRTSALEGRLLDLDEWWVSADKGDVLDAERAYQQGYAFARWLRDETGHDVMAAMAAEAGQRYRLDWGRLLRRQTGEPPRITWARWRASAFAEAASEAARIRADGATEGVELEDWEGGWVAARRDLDARDRWLRRPRRDREEAREATGAFDLFPRTSPDGRWTGVSQAGWVHVWRGAPTDLRAPPERTGARGARAARTSAWIPVPLGSSFAFVPGRDAVVVVADVDADRGRLGRGAAPDGLGQLALVDLTPATEIVRHRGGRVPVETLDPWRPRARIHRIPGTERGRDPAVSPDGRQIAWLSYGDGTTNLVVSGLDGSAPRALSAFDDGTWLQHPSWSPDGRSVVVSALRTDRPDLWRIDVASGVWRRLTDDAQEELDPVWAADGIWFAADPGDVFDVFRLDPETGRVERMTREIGGAHTPWPLPGGDLLYAAQTASGFKAVRLPASEVLAEPATGFRWVPPGDGAREAAADLAFRPQVSDVPARRYRPLRSLLVPGVGPILRVDGVPARATPLGGAFFRARDAVERFDLQAYGLVGEDLLGQAELTWRGLPPELGLWAAGSTDRGPGGRALSAAAGGLTARFRLRSWATLEIAPQRLSTSDGAGARVRSVRIVGGLRLGVPPAAGATGSYGALTLTRAWSQARDALGGAAGWHRVALEAGRVLRTPVRTGPLAEHATRLELDGFVGVTDRRVTPDERLFAGGDLPGALRLGAPAASRPLSGFAAYAVSGEVLAVGQGTWVLPVAPRLRARAGPLYVGGLAVGVGGGAALAGPPDLRAPTPLAQVDAELRWTAVLLDSPWDGGLRIGWGFGRPGGTPWSPAGVDLGGPRVSLSLGVGL